MPYFGFALHCTFYSEFTAFLFIVFAFTVMYYHLLMYYSPIVLIGYIFA